MSGVLSRVDRCKELGFFVAEFSIEILRNFEPEKMHTRLNFDFEIEATRKLAIIHLSVEVSYDEKFVLLEHNCVFEYLVPDLENALDQDGLLHNDVVLDLVREAFAMARGMIAVRTLGFGIHDFSLPLMDQGRVSARILELLAAKREVLHRPQND
jgi:hypothetical protein